MNTTAAIPAYAALIRKLDWLDKVSVPHFSTTNKNHHYQNDTT